MAVLLRHKSGYNHLCCDTVFLCEVFGQMRILVCDDMRNDRENLVQNIKSVWPGAAVEEAADGGEVIEKVRKGQVYDLIFLDIYMDHLDGIEAGKWIYENFPGMYLVFVSESRDFGPELFEINALHYLVKPCRREDLWEVRRRFAERERKDAVVQVGNRDKDDIPFQMITYIESVHNNLEIHLLSGGMVTVRNSLQNFMEKLDDRFLRINRGIAVNMDAVEKMNTDSCEICGMTFMLSRKTRQESRKKYNDFLFASVVRLK